ncbi:MAG: RNA-binding domain-containing protein [Candidatus Odinarchaeota archaeon]
MPKAKKKSKKTEKPLATIKLTSVLIETLQQETESDKAFDQIFSFLSTAAGIHETAVKRSLLTGTFGNSIVRHSLDLSGKEGMTFLKGVLPNLKLSAEEIDGRLSRNLSFSFKLDKQAAYQQQLKSTNTGSDCIQVTVKFTAHGRKEQRREMILEMVETFSS